MNILNNNSILSNFDVSIILPFYKKLSDFEKILPVNAKYFQRNGIEVVISMDESSEKDGLLELIKEYPLINWIIIYNNEPHEWRNPSKAINVGIKASTKKFILVCSPESQFHTDVIYQLRYYCEYYDSCFCIGRVEFSSYDCSIENKRSAPYGSICVRREYIDLVSGYSECFFKWGAEDDNFRSKLEYKGIKKIYIEQAVLIHYEDEDALKKRHLKVSSVSLGAKKKGINPKKSDFFNKGWGNDYSNIAYTYLK